MSTTSIPQFNVQVILHAGPIFVGEDYQCRRQLVTFGETPKAEFRCCRALDVVVADQRNLKMNGFFEKQNISMYCTFLEVQVDKNLAVGEKVWQIGGWDDVTGKWQVNSVRWLWGKNRPEISHLFLGNIKKLENSCWESKITCSLEIVRLVLMHLFVTSWMTNLLISYMRWFDALTWTSPSCAQELYKSKSSSINHFLNFNLQVLEFSNDLEQKGWIFWPLKVPVFFLLC